MKQFRKGVITFAVRTPVGAYNECLASLYVPKFGSMIIQALFSRLGVRPDQVDEVIMGNVLKTAVGYAPASQAAIFAGLTTSISAMAINKVRESGLETVILTAQGLP